MNPTKWWTSARHWLVLPAAVALLWWVQGVMEHRRSVEQVPYSRFEQYLHDGQLTDVQVGETTIRGSLREPRDGKRFVIAERVDPATAERLSPYGVPYGRLRESSWVGETLLWLAPTLFFFVLWHASNRRLGVPGGPGLLGIGQSRAKVYAERSTGVRFDDVAGVDEAKAELQEIVDFLRDPKAHGRLGARMPKGVLLVGPTGTGKTLLARAVAGEAGVAFFSISGSEFIELFVGVGAARVRDLFEQARAAAPAIIFIDELDALGKARGLPGLSGVHDEREQTLNQLLVELDGFDPRVGVVLLAATNRPEILDPALLRAGRFDRQVLVDRPDRLGRAAILRVHAQKVLLAPETDLEQVAAVTVGFAGADLANLVNEAALIATRHQASAVTLADFTEAIERIVAGIEKKHRLVSEPERWLIAYHELGHALTALALPGADRVHKVSIVPRGIGALGYTLRRPSEDRRVLRRSELFDRLTVLLGGRAAERLVFGEPSTGAADDLVRATELARDMVLRYGMDDELGPVSYGDGPARALPSELPRFAAPESPGPATTERIDRAVHDLLEDALARARRLLKAHRPVLEQCAGALVERETLDENELLALAGPLRGPSTAAKLSAAA